MSDVTLWRRIAALVVMAFLSVMGATAAAATVADSADARACDKTCEESPRNWRGDG